MPISDEARKAHRGCITCSRSQWLDWIQTQVCVPHTPIGGGSKGHWISLPTHIGLLGNTGSEAKGQPGIFRIEDKVVDKSEQPKVASLWQSLTKEKPRCSDLSIGLSLLCHGELRCHICVWRGKPERRVTSRCLPNPHRAPGGDEGERNPYCQTHMVPIGHSPYLSSPGEFLPQCPRGWRLCCQSHLRAGEFHILPRSSQGKGSGFRHHQTWKGGRALCGGG